MEDLIPKKHIPNRVRTPKILQRKLSTFLLTIVFYGKYYNYITHIQCKNHSQLLIDSLKAKPYTRESSRFVWKYRRHRLFITDYSF